jgi:hypothetical protein
VLTRRTAVDPLRSLVPSHSIGRRCPFTDPCIAPSRRISGIESRCDEAVGRTYLLPPLSSGGASLLGHGSVSTPPLIESDWRIFRIRLSDKTSGLHLRRAATQLCQAYEPEVPVKVREWGAGQDFPKTGGLMTHQEPEEPLELAVRAAPISTAFSRAPTRPICRVFCAAVVSTRFTWWFVAH